MSEVAAHIRRIQERLQLLIKQHQDLQKENQQLKKDLERTAKQGAQHLETIQILKQQVEVLKLSSGTWEENDKKELEKRINQYIREIDKCIALLSE